MQQEKERRERAERERIERERERQNREKQISAVDAVDHHFQLSMELAKKVSDLLQCHFKFEVTFSKVIHLAMPLKQAHGKTPMLE